jgi:hypothetical protein
MVKRTFDRFRLDTFTGRLSSDFVTFAGTFVDDGESKGLWSVVRLQP